MIEEKDHTPTWFRLAGNLIGWFLLGVACFSAGVAIAVLLKIEGII